MRWTKGVIDKILTQAIKRKGFGAIYSRYGYSSESKFVRDIIMYATKLKIRFKVDNAFRRIWDKNKCIEIAEYIKENGRQAAMDKYNCTPYMSLYYNLLYASRKHGIGEICDDSRLKFPVFDKEFCEHVIEEVKEDGIDKVSKKYGYACTNSFINNLQKGSIRYNIVSDRDEFKKLIGK